MKEASIKRRALLIIASLSLAVSSVVFAQQAGPSKSPSRTVELNLIVTGSDKKSPPSIRKEDIQLVEDKIKQTILSIELRTFFPKNKKDLLGAATQIVADLRSQFRLTYESTSDKKGFRKVDVKLTPASGEKLAAVLPSGYYFPN